MPKRKRTIVCVGNDAFGLEVRRLVLESFGYNAIVKPDCDSLFVVLGVRPVDMVMLDFSDLSEVENSTIRTIRERYPKQLLMLLAPIPYVDPKITAMVDCVLTKGATPSEFKAAIEGCFGPKGTGGKLARAMSFVGAFIGVASEVIRHRRSFNVISIDRASARAQRTGVIRASR